MSIVVRNNTNISPKYIKPIYVFENKPDYLPSDPIINRYAWLYGSFIRYLGVTVPTVVVGWSFDGERPTKVQPVMMQGFTDPTGEVNGDGLSQIFGKVLNVDEVDEFYYFLPYGISLERYLSEYIRDVSATKRKIHGAVKRSLDVPLITAPNRWTKEIKNAYNKGVDGEIYVANIDQNSQDRINIVEYPSTVDSLEKLWQSYDKTKQSMLSVLGIAYNPAKRERLVTDEVLLSTQEIEMYRKYVTDCAIESASKYNVTVKHISQYLTDQRNGNEI